MSNVLPQFIHHVHSFSPFFDGFHLHFVGQIPHPSAMLAHFHGHVGATGDLAILLGPLHGDTAF